MRVIRVDKYQVAIAQRVVHAVELVVYRAGNQQYNLVKRVLVQSGAQRPISHHNMGIWLLYKIPYRLV